MLKFCILAAIVAIAASGRIDDGTYLINTNQKQFSLNMLDALCTKYPNDNIFFSPHSTYRALLLAYIGAEGDTEVSLKQVLQLGWATSKQEVLAAYKTGLDAIESRSFGDKVECNSVDKAYVTKDAKLKSPIPDILTNKQIERVNFANPEGVRTRINSQVAEVTQQHIKDLLPPGSVSSSSNIVLANAAFFRGTWENIFDKSMTSNTTFFNTNGERSGTVEMMYVDKAEFFRGELSNEDVEFCELAYQDKDRAIVMTVFIPNSDTVDELVKKITPETFVHTKIHGSRDEIAVKFPKLSMEKDYSLGQILEDQMGVKNLFGSRSNYSGFADNVAVTFDDFVHKAVLNVDEDGTTAAAATASVGRGGKSDIFVANSPFVYTITDKVSNEVLFAGVYRGPKH